ncbi:MAG TPA: Rieske 2Fe-2S domain-containing protein [Acidimicrobiales bacterium]|jgi:fatty-acyl-CoA synthase|nr:Rieske 2Fe-2S domain-containing protein [Acidimicrobiales bacterium]
MITEFETAQPSIPYAELVLPDRVNSRIYTDPAIFEDEMEKIWEKDWLYVGHDSEVANRGDYVARRMGRQPVVLARGMDGVVRVLMNRCPHRGNTVCLEDSGNVDHFRCAYHGWMFNTDGSPKGVPYSAGYGEGFDKMDFAMTVVPRMEVHRGFVFASLSPTGQDLKAKLGRTYDYLDRFADMSPEGEIDLSAGALKTKVHGNWKMVYENVADGYHPPFLHRSVFAASSRDGLVIGDAYGDNSLIVTRDLDNGHIMLDFTETNRITGGAVFDVGGPVAPEAVEAYRAAVRARMGEEAGEQLLADGLSNVGICPNLGMLYQDVRVIEPVSVNETVIYNFPALLKGAPRDINRSRMYQEVRAYGPGGSVGPDDHEIYERNQIGFQAKLNNWVVLRRGLDRQYRDDDGTLVGNASDEVTMRGFWRHYLSVMSGS